MIGRKGLEGGWRTPLHAATDWPGYFPDAPRAVALLLGAGANPNDDCGGERAETPLHWAASTDDVEVAIPLIVGGAHLGGSIGTQLDNAIGDGCWHVARLLVARGARVAALWHRGARDSTLLEEFLAATPRPTAEDLNEAFWQPAMVASDGSPSGSSLLVPASTPLPGYENNQTALDAAAGPDTRRDLLASWLRERGATSADDD